MKWHKDKDAMEVVGRHQSFLVAVRGSRLLSAIAYYFNFFFFCTSQMPKKMFSIKIIFLKNNFAENIFRRKIFWTWVIGLQQPHTDMKSQNHLDPLNPTTLNHLLPHHSHLSYPPPPPTPPTIVATAASTITTPSLTIATTTFTFSECVAIRDPNHGLVLLNV